MPRIALVLLAVALGGTAAAQTPAGIDSVYAAFSQAYATTDADLIRSIYTEDCRYLPAHTGHVQTCEEALGGFAAMFAGAEADGGRLAIEFAFVDRQIDGDLATDVGYYHLTSTPADGEPGHGYGKFVTVLVREADGRWRIHVDGYSPASAEAFEAAKASE